MSGIDDSLAKIAEQVSICTKCPLGFTRTHAVPGEGPADAAIFFIGEGPGQREDEQGRPFVGASGNLLAGLLKGIGLSREQVFITNVVKCRPPGNRDPRPVEIAACRDYLDRQLALVRPYIVVTLGRFSMERYFPGGSITRIHGQVRRTGETSYVPLYHPAAALRNEKWRTELKADFEKLRELLEDTDTERRS